MADSALLRFKQRQSLPALRPDINLDTQPPLFYYYQPFLNQIKQMIV